MKRAWFGLLAFGATAVFVMTAVSQPPGGGPPGDRPGGPPGGGGPGGPGRGGPPRFQLGAVLPPFARDELQLSKEQEDQIAALEKDVKDRLGKILTADQVKQLETMRPRRPGGPGGPGGPPGGGGPGGPPPGDRPEGRGRPQPPPPPGDEPPAGDDPVKADPAAAGIQWFATWESGLKEARRTGKPILLVSAAPHCAGVSGIW